MGARAASVSGRGALCVLALAAACGREPGTPPSTVTDSAGVRIVTSTEGAWHRRGVRIDSIPLLRIGAEEAGPYLFAFVSAGVLLERGVIAVVEQSTAEIRLFDAEGRHIRSVGRRGRGPGEFQSISGLFRVTGDSLAAFDQSQRRLTVFPQAGGEPRVVRSQAVPGGRGDYDAFGALGDGRLLLYNPGGGFRPDLEPGLQWVPTEVVALDPSDGAAQTIARLPSREQFVLPGGDTRVRAPAHDAIRAATQDGFYWGTSDRYEIRFFDIEGNLQRILRRPVEPSPVVPAMIEAWIARNLEDVRRREGESEVPRYRRIYEEASFGDEVPVFERAFVDHGGRLWVGSSGWPDRLTAPARWSVFSATGNWLGELDAPPQFRIVDCRDDLVLGVWQEEGDAPYVQVHRLLGL